MQHFNYEKVLPLPSTFSTPSSPSMTASLKTRKLVFRYSILAVFTLICLGILQRSSNGQSTNISFIGTKGYLSGMFPHKPKEAEGTGGRKRRNPWQSPTPPLPLYATLDERLESLELDSPIAESAEIVNWNINTCPGHRIARNQNGDQLRNSHLLWSSMNSTFVTGVRMDMINHLRSAQRNGLLEPSRWGTGRGLVFTAGNADTFSRVLVTLSMIHKNLEDYNSARPDSPPIPMLPSEIFSFPDENPPEDLLPKFQELNATLRKIEHKVMKSDKRRKNFQIKATAILECSFREVLYLDSDNLVAGDVLFEDPANPGISIWESKAYQRLGALFWPDYWRTTADNPIWAIIGTQCRNEWEQEAGQILIDKSRHLDVLVLSSYMLQDWEFWFNFSDGDKDVFRYSMLALRKRWGVPGRYVGAGALPWNTLSGFCGHTMLQHDHMGRPTFVHMNLMKQIPSGVYKGYSWGRTRSLPGFTDDGENEFVDMDLDADMLSNALTNGVPLGWEGKSEDISPMIRRRAAIEMGLRPYFHGGVTSALCIDFAWEDPRSDNEKASDMKHLQSFVSHLPSDPSATVSAQSSGEIHYDKESSDPRKWNPETTVIGQDGLQIVYENPTEVRVWKNDDRLRNFEELFYSLGGKPNGKGF